MEVRFYRGLVRQEDRANVQSVWAEAPFGIMCLADRTGDDVKFITGPDIALSEPIATLDLAGADRESVEAVISSVLKGGYLEKTGVSGGGEAVLFILVNEALHELRRLYEEEDAEATTRQGCGSGP